MRIIVSYRGIPQSRGWATGDFVVKAFRELGHTVFPYGNYYETNEMIEGNTLASLSGTYDLYLQMECGDGDRFYEELKNINVVARASWWFDLSLYPRRWLLETNYLGCEFNFVANKNFVKDHEIYLPYAADYDKHARPIFFDSGQYVFLKHDIVYPVTKDIDFLIIGSDRPERRQLYESIQSLVPNANVQYVTNAFREEYVDTLMRSHYVINDIAGGGAGLIPMRPFEVIAAGSHLITPQDDGVHDLGIPCLEYRNEEELFNLIKELDSRWRPVRFGFQEKFLRRHTYTRRCHEILSNVFPEYVCPN